MKKSKSDMWLFVGIGVLLVGIAVFSAFQLFSLESLLGERVAEVKVAAAPAKITITTLEGPECEECFTLDPLIDAIKQTNVEIKEERLLEFGSQESGKLIEEHDVERLPTVIVTGEVDKASLSGLEKSGDVLVFRDVFAPFALPDGAIQGRVKSTIVFDSACAACYDPSPVVDTLKQAGVFVYETKKVDAQTEQGQALVEQYALDVLPAIVFSEELSVYEGDFLNNWEAIGTIEDGQYVTRRMAPPYYNVSAGDVFGEVSMTLLLDETCADCLDASEFYEGTLQAMGVYLESTARLDVSDSEAQKLIDDLNITKVPTMIMEGEVQAYPTLVAAWQQVGSQDDGKWVFRNVEVAQQPYRDLISGEIVRANATESADA